LNITTGKDGHPEAVLVRGVDGIIGPGRVTKAMKIDRSFNRQALIPENKLWLEDDGVVLKYVTDKRVGIDYANESDRNKHWRFIAIIEK
jgi:DNA-3-methyladenine glycosylase